MSNAFFLGPSFPESEGAVDQADLQPIIDQQAENLQKINDEAAQRQDGDASLQDAIDAEVVNRAEGDVAISSALDNAVIGLASDIINRKSIDPVRIPKPRDWVLPRGGPFSNTFDRLVDEAGVAYDAIVTDGTEANSIAGERAIEYTAANGNGSFPSIPQVMDFRQSSGRIYELTLDVEHLAGEEASPQFLVRSYDAGGNQQDSFFIAGFGAFQFGRRVVRAYVCGDPADAISFAGITPQALPNSNDNTAFGRVSAGVRGQVTQRIYSLEIRDVTVEMRMRRTVLDVERYGVQIGDDVTAAQAVRNAEAINAAWADASEGDTGCTALLPAGVIMLDRIGSVLEGREHFYAILNPGGGTLRGRGAGLTTLRIRDTAGSVGGASCHGILTVNEGNFIVSDLIVDGNRDQQNDGGDFGGNDPAGMIVVGDGREMEMISVDRCGFVNTFDYGFGGEGETVVRNFVMRDCFFRNNGSDPVDIKGFGGVHQGLLDNIDITMGLSRPDQPNQAGIDVRVGIDCSKIRVRGLNGSQRGVRTVEHEQLGFHPMTFSDCRVEASEAADTVAFAFQTGYVSASNLYARGTARGILNFGAEYISVTGAQLINTTLPMELLERGEVVFDSGVGPASSAKGGRYEGVIIRSENSVDGPPIDVEAGNDDNYISATISGYTSGVTDAGQRNTFDLKVA